MSLGFARFYGMEELDLFAMRAGVFVAGIGSSFVFLIVTRIYAPRWMAGEGSMWIAHLTGLIAIAAVSAILYAYRSSISIPIVKFDNDIATNVGRIFLVAVIVYGFIYYISPKAVALYRKLIIKYP